jgi:glycosyltransferase involved in cell wall biosynthesis
MNKRVLFLFPGAGRKARIEGVSNGSVPKEFFYGLISLWDKGYDVKTADSRTDPSGFLSLVLLMAERLRNRILNLGFTRARVIALAPELKASDVAISFTDAFSLSLGLYGRHQCPGTRLIGGFCGLTDTVAESKSLFPERTERQIKKAVHGLDHVFFLGEYDRQQAILRYGLPEERTSLFRFGVDTDFWTPQENRCEEDIIFSAGSDPKRDFATLINASIGTNIHILTRQRLTIPAAKPNIHLVRGSYHQAAISDIELRNMYRKAAIVVVPLRDVNQPTGCSVTLQAMACGKPVVLSRIRGLWDPEVLISGENCILVPPGDSEALSEAVESLRSDETLRQRIGSAARKTAAAHFSMERMNNDVELLIHK